MPPHANDLSALESRFEITDLMSEKAGTFLYKAREKVSAKKVLLKCSSSKTAMASDVAKLENHYHVSQQLSSEFVLPTLDFYITENLRVLVLEDLGSGPLHEFAERKLYCNGDDTKLQYLPAFYLVLKIAQAIAFFEKKSIIHGNLTPETIWVDMSSNSLHVVDLEF